MTADIVVAGAGHNSLITAAYLAASGREVLVLDSRAIPGGGAATEELLGPGYLIDSCSTGHTLIQTNPLLLQDELGLKERYGLEYLVPDPFAHVAFPDGEQLTAWMDLERTVEEIARFSKADGEAYRRLLADYDEVKHVFAAGTFNPPGMGPSVEQLLREHPQGQRVAAAPDDERLGRHPARVREPARAGASCSGRPTRRWCRSTRPAPGRWRTRSCSAASGGAGRSRAAARAG